MKYHTEDFEHDQNEPILNHKTIVSLDGQPVGMIQDIKVQANVKDAMPTIEITFPNLLGGEVDPNYIKTSSLARDLAEMLEKLKRIPNIKVKLEDLEWNK